MVISDERQQPGSPPDFAGEKRPCDLIMRGGITSGVVFPKAITRLATQYSFFCIGGTSAGSIAAVMAAAAEYRRQTAGTDEEKAAGFGIIDGMAVDLASNLRSLFQPSAGTETLFGIAMAIMEAEGRALPLIRRLVETFAGRVAAGIAIGAVFVLIALAHASFWAGALGLLLMAVLPVVLIVAPLWSFFWKSLTKTLPKSDFGLCTGLRSEGSQRPGFTEWMADKLDAIVAKDSADPNYTPLTAGDLKLNGQPGHPDRPRIKVASVTTDLSSRRPYQLPLGTAIFSFRKAEFARLFPERILRYLTDKGGPLMKHDDPATPFVDVEGHADYYRLPTGDDFPILLVARLSLSFPGLISAVPLYRFDFSLNPSGQLARNHTRCLFSDGGITSNFPIHFFDSLIPGRPTFGISLGSYDERRVRSDPNDKRKSRIFMPDSARSDAAPIEKVASLSQFLGSILTTARNWQDTLQSRLHGYRERIVEIRLDDSREGGMNLDMSRQTIEDLAEYGEFAGDEMLGFDFDEHRYRRMTTAFPALQDAFQRFAEVWPAYPTDMQAHTPTSFRLSAADLQTYVEFGNDLAALGRKYEKKLKRVSRQRASVRIVAAIDTDDPQAAASAGIEEEPIGDDITADRDDERAPDSST